MPTTCSASDHVSSWSAPCGGHQIGARTNRPNQVAATGIGWRRPTAVPETSATPSGTAHTQWWLQETGEQSNAIVPQTDTLASRSPRDQSARASHKAPTTVTTTRTSHSRPPPAVSPLRRMSRPFHDWLLAYASAPIRPVSGSSSVQYCQAVRGATTKPITTVPANAAMAWANARHWRVTSSRAKKTSGVSLIPAAIPTQIPRAGWFARTRS